MHDVWLVAGTLERDSRTSLPFVVRLNVQQLQGTKRDISTLRIGQICDLADHQASRAGWRPATRNPARRGRPPKPDRFYMTIAAAYLYYESNGSSTPVIDLATALGLEPKQAKRYLEKARQRRFLTPGIQGRPGAWAGPALWDGLGGELGLSEPNESWRDLLTVRQLDSDESLPVASRSTVYHASTRTRRNRRTAIRDAHLATASRPL